MLCFNVQTSFTLVYYILKCIDVLINSPIFNINSYKLDVFFQLKGEQGETIVHDICNAIGQFAQVSPVFLTLSALLSTMSRSNIPVGIIYTCRTVFTMKISSIYAVRFANDDCTFVVLHAAALLACRRARKCSFIDSTLIKLG